MAVVYNFACHPLFGDAKGSITANYPGVASKVIEERLNGATALFVQGAAGDLMDFNFKTFLPLYIQYKMDTNHPLDHSYRYLRERYLGQENFPRMDDINRTNIAKYLANIAAMEKLARIQDQISTLKKHKQLNDDSGEKTIKAEIQGIRVGDCAILASPLELLAQIGLNLKKASPFKHTLVAGYSNGYMHYGPPASYYEAGGYEVTQSLLAPEWQKIFESKSKEIAERLKK